MQKQINYFVRLFVMFLAMTSSGNLLFAKTIPVQLKCEYHLNPIGIDVTSPRLSWQIVTDRSGYLQSAFEIKVSSSEAGLKNTKNLIWSSGKVASDQSVNVEYTGAGLQPMQRYFWQVRVWDNDGKPSDWSAPAFWEMGMLQPSQWSASWITSPSEKDNAAAQPAHFFRKEFATAKPIQSARLYITSLGLYEAYINGKRVGDELFTPGWTSYKKRVQYQTYDVTSLVGASNTIGAIVGDGWYRGFIGFSGQRSYYGTKSALLAQLRIVYTDGTESVVASGSDWKTATGPILESDIYNGEIYDARLEMGDWCKPGFDDAKWVSVATYQYPKENIVAPQGDPVKAIEEIKPVKVFRTPKNELVLDMGQNLVGWVKIKLSGKAGDKVTLKYAEVLDKAGNFYIDNLRAAKATDIYTLKGGGEEVYQPRFTFHGFRYVMVEGVEQIAAEQVIGVVIHSEMAPTGTFSCSNELINQLQHNIQWGQKGNFLDVPTDCPQRDERLGWTGDAQVFSMTAAFNFDVAAFYTKWMKDLSLDQAANGSVPYVIPDVLNGAGASTAWADVAVIVPWTVYRVYGDKRILEQQYASMKLWIEYMRQRAGDDLIWSGDFHFGDWLAFASNRSDYTGATTEKDLIATAYFRYSSMLVSKIAGIIGNEQDAKSYAALSDKVKEAFIKEFVTASGRLVSHTQTAYSLALAFDLLPESLKEAAAGFLANDVKSFGHLTTGFVGTPLLCKTLAETGHADLAFMLLNRKEYPSWLYPVTQGATTIWERWDGQKPDGSFQDVGMNSFNHYAYGAIGEWLYHYVAGLDLDVQKPGYKHIIFHPHPGGNLTHASAEFKSLYGLITSSWKIDQSQFNYEVTVPANTTASVILPIAAFESLMVNGLPVSGAKNVKAFRDTENTKVEIGSGKYLLSYQLK